MSESMTYSGVPVWQKDSDVQECPICETRFNFLYRKHHCRMCGRVICGNCSPTYELYLATTYVVAPPYQPFLESPHVPHRTCTQCSSELAMIRRALSLSPSGTRNHTANSPNLSTDQAPRRDGVSSRIPAGNELMVQSVVPGADNDYLGRCPVCDKQLFTMPEHMQEAHVDSCLKTYSMSPAEPSGPQQLQRKRMIISRLMSKDCQSLGDCNICYEDFEPGQSIGRLECFCVFHEKCILEWFSRKGVGSCPLHNHDH